VFPIDPVSGQVLDLAFAFVRGMPENAVDVPSYELSFFQNKVDKPDVLVDLMNAGNFLDMKLVTDFCSRAFQRCLSGGTEQDTLEASESMYPALSEEQAQLVKERFPWEEEEL